MGSVIKVEAHVDWLDVTVRADEPLRVQADFTYKVSEMARRRENGDERRPFGVLGYRGWKQGAVIYGERSTDFMARATGPAADSLARTLVGTRMHVARLDVAATVWFDEDRPGYARQFAAAAAVARENGTMRPNTHIRHVNGFGGGDTAYIGSAKSERLLRVYDKWRESGKDEYQFAWRFEVQLRNDYALLAWKAYEQAVDREAFCKDFLAGYLTERGLASFRHMGYWGAPYSLVSTTTDHGRDVAFVALIPGCPHCGAPRSIRLRGRGV